MKFNFFVYKCIVISVLLSGWVCLPVRLTAQLTDSAWSNAAYIRHSSPWLQNGNAAGLRYLPVKSISDAAVSIDKSSGKFINYYQSDNSLSYAVQTSSYFRMNKRSVFQGGVSYQNFNGKNMQGSAWIDPYRNPLDIDEYTDTTAGTKKLEKYHLTGSVSTDLSSKWTLGASVHYTAANYAKIKDMRHLNKLLHLDLDAGVNYRINNRNEVGINVQYGRRIESLSFSISGNTDRQYISLINFGSFYGNAELHSLNGYTAEENPMVDISKKIAALYSHQFSGNIIFLNEFSYAVRDGYYGKKSSTGIMFTQHRGDAYVYKGIITEKNNHSLHSLSLEAEYSNLDNAQSVYRRETAGGGNSVIVYYGSNDVFNQKILEGKIEYASFLHVQHNHPLWIIKADANYYTRSQIVTIYPYYRKQTINHYDLSAFAERNFLAGKNLYAVSFNLLYGGGYGTAKEDGQYSSGGTSQTVPASRDRYLYQEYEYFTKPRIESSIGIKYAYANTAATNVYVQLTYNYIRAFDVSYTGTQRNGFLLNLGYNF